MSELPRPIYCIGHNTNTVEEIAEGLKRGLNAFEPDIHVDQNGELFVSHGRVRSPFAGRHPMRVGPFLRELRQLFASPAGSNAALLMLDCKIDDPAKAIELRDLVRKELTDHVAVAILYSVPTIGAAERFFPDMLTALRQNEAVMIDEEDHPGDVATVFERQGTVRGCYGNGISTIPGLGIGLPSPNLAVQMDAAVALRALGRFAWTYSWVLVESDTIVEHLRIGVDGIMVDVSNASVIQKVLAHPDMVGRVRLASRTDDAFRAVDWPVLTVVTSNVSAAGTDAAVTFTLEQANGTRMERKVDGSYAGRFERRGTNAVTFAGHGAPSPAPMTIIVRSDHSRWGADWHLASTTLRSRNTQERTARFDEWFVDGTPRSRPI